MKKPCIQCPNIANPFLECLYNDLAEQDTIRQDYCLNQFYDCPVFRGLKEYVPCRQCPVQHCPARSLPTFRRD
ncbi:hypothetical protein [Geobacter sp. SVR]|uniref:hypothetical protein n=1 Tax=Geobacter sp. SVR TaxID=2495594 RepID=UPI00143EFA40|nr:hypothetical protein [Geobacter sp. SVR]BCS53529.1 hypothetical protein GSVR_18370 [Geobacter sp. SVR]GCF84274.1 hypothetical protein GSbR_08740 [Geobacter sp. SVR]